MWIYLRSRRVGTCAIAVIATSAVALPLRSAWALNREESFIVFPLGLVGTVVVAMAFTLTLSGRFEQFEALGSRSRPLGRAIHAVTGVAIIVAITTGAALVARQVPPYLESTIGDLAPVRAVLGMLGVGLAAAAFVDIRIASATTIPVFVVPLAFNPGVVPGGDLWGFVLAPAASNIAWATAVATCVLGLVTYVFAYRERAAPALSRPRTRRRRTRG